MCEPANTFRVSVRLLSSMLDVAALTAITGQEPTNYLPKDAPIGGPRSPLRKEHAWILDSGEMEEWKDDNTIESIALAFLKRVNTDAVRAAIAAKQVRIVVPCSLVVAHKGKSTLYIDPELRDLLALTEAEMYTDIYAQ